jgi:hypothetical protein
MLTWIRYTQQIVIIPGMQFVAHMTTAVVGSSCVDTSLAAATIVAFALVDICRDENDWARTEM